MGLWMDLVESIVDAEKNILLFLRRNIVALAIVLVISVALEYSLFLLGMVWGYALWVLPSVVLTLCTLSSMCLGAQLKQSCKESGERSGIICCTSDVIGLVAFVITIVLVTEITLSFGAVDWYFLTTKGITYIYPHHADEYSQEGTFFQFDNGSFFIDTKHIGQYWDGATGNTICVAPIITPFYNYKLKEPIYLWTGCPYWVFTECAAVVNTTSCMIAWRQQPIEGMKVTDPAIYRLFNLAYQNATISLGLDPNTIPAFISLTSLTSIQQTGVKVILSVGLLNVLLVLVCIIRWPIIWRRWHPVIPQDNPELPAEVPPEAQA